LDDRADGLVTEDRARLDLGDVALEDVEVCAADRGRVDADDCVGWILNGRVGLLFPSAKPRPVVDECLHGSSFRSSRAWPTLVSRASAGSRKRRAGFPHPTGI